MTIKEELDKIICDRCGINDPDFDLVDYLYKSWVTEDRLYEAIEDLIKRRTR